MKISVGVQERLSCPHCRSRLSAAELLLCECCGNVYPIISGIPILIDEATSNFRLRSYQHPQSLSKGERAKRSLRWLLPTISLNVAARRNYARFRDIVLAMARKPRVLIIGGATVGVGLRELLADTRIEFVESDIVIDERTSLVCDAHTLPFADQSFDGVIVQTVLLYLQQYQRCIAEMLRVLKPGGAVYSETPFMEQVVGGAYDFYRFTLTGHEYNFRDFERVSSGITGGPAMATAWSIQYLLLSFTKSTAFRAAIRIFCKCTLFWMKYLDLVLVTKPGAVDAAAGTYFLGLRPTLKAERVAAHTVEPLPAYRGLVRTDVRAFR
jgi:SAM-dependent methyltransferase